MSERKLVTDRPRSDEAVSSCASPADDDARVSWFAREVLPYEPAIRRWLTRRAGELSASDRDEIVQETYARIWAVDVLRIINVRSYLFVIARRIVGETIRRLRIVPIRTVTDLELVNIADETTPEQQLTERQNLEALLRAMEALPRKCRMAFELKKLEGLSQREIASRMGIAESTVEKHLAKALRILLEATHGQPAPESRTHERSAQKH